MTEYTRVSVSGTNRRADVVLPDGEPIGAALPHLLTLLAEPTPTVQRPLTLVFADGEEVDLTGTPAQLGLDDGALLRLTHVDSAPPPPVVIDVADAAAERHNDRLDRWSDRSRVLLASVAMAIVAALSTSALPLTAAGSAAVLGGLLTVVLIAAVLTGLLGAPRISAVLSGAAYGLTVPLVLSVGTLTSASPVGIATLLVAAAGLVLALATGVARRSRAALTGGVIAVVLGGVQWGLLATGLLAERAVTIPAIIAVAMTGVLPWIALSSSGLNDLDRRATANDRVARTVTRDSIDAAYATLTWGVLATTAIAVIDAVTLLAAGGLWATLLAVAIVLILALRTRSFPLTPAVVILWTGVLVVLAAAAVIVLPSLGVWSAVVAAAVAALIAVLGLVRPRPHVRARLRGWGNLLEMIAVVSLVPVTLGVWNVYHDLLGLFTGGNA